MLCYINAVSVRSYVQYVLNPCDQSGDLKKKTQWEELDGHWLNDQTERDNIHCSSHFPHGQTKLYEVKMQQFCGQLVNSNKINLHVIGIMG